ncbi:MAG: type II toxin-antitoxin system PemK/MazF family toxin [Defluviitaleaceae bacterium]|nr:type II toxin-antitoxin system PemK/MazF family toxin [Defluviitaleaceae bacterium]
MEIKNIKRGELYYARLNPVVGSEQGDTRPVLIISNDIGNTHSPTVIVIPLTGRLRKPRLPTHVFIPQGHGPEAHSIALAEQIRTIDRSRIDRYIGRIDGDLQLEIDMALAAGIGLVISI